MKVSHTGKYTKNNRKNLYVFASKDPESVVNTKLRCLCEGLDFGGAFPVRYYRIVGQKVNKIFAE